jgi:hypothetical protein
MLSSREVKRYPDIPPPEKKPYMTENAMIPPAFVTIPRQNIKTLMHKVQKIPRLITPHLGASVAGRTRPRMEDAFIIGSWGVS